MSKAVFKPFRRIAGISLLCLPAMLLVACGGGGGGGGGDGAGAGSGSTTGPTAAAVVITSTNAKALAANAMELAADGDYASGAASLALGAQVDAGGSGGAVRLAGVARQIAGMTPTAPSMATGVAFQQSQPCPSGGSLDVSGTMSDGATGITAGDTMSYTAVGCKMGPDTTWNGKMTITFHSSLSATTTFPFQLSMSYTVENFTITDSTGTETINGDMRMDISASSSTSEKMTVSGGSLTTAGGTLFNYSVSIDVDGSMTRQSVSGAVQTTSTHISTAAFSYTIATVTPVTYSDTGTVTGGVIKVTGSGSTLLITVTGSNTFKLEVDANGDGTYESTQTTTRSELEALL